MHAQAVAFGGSNARNMRAVQVVAVPDRIDRLSIVKQGHHVGFAGKFRMIDAHGCVKNADALCKGLISRGFDIVSGGTDNHLMLVNLISKGVTGKEVEKLLDAANITCNKNTIPNDPASPFVTSGIRLGTAAVTTRGFNTDDMDVVAEAISLLVDDVEKNQAKAVELVKGLTDKYPLY